ncbi:MAG: AAA family ATPase [Anaerolineae bacterium]|nr:AAA family ATPase [Anaerolineae bacterium]
MTERQQLEQAIAAQESLRATLGDAVVDATVAALRQRLSELEHAGAATPALSGERKLVTVMFADISDFTALADQMDPEGVRELLNACFSRLVPIIEHYDGVVDKFIGDGVMALFGAPVTHENDPERALLTALALREEVRAFSAEREVGLGIHFGINTGLVIAGSIGAQGREEYSVMGDAVNLAARLEELSQSGEVLVGPDTYRLTSPRFDFEALEPLTVKGKEEPVSAYRLLGLRKAPGQARGIAGLDSPLVGRRRELALLQEAVRRLIAGTGGAVTVIGEAGLGKSRLVAELRYHVHGPRSRVDPALGLGLGVVDWLEGRCLSYGTSIVYLLWLDLLRDALAVTVEDPPPVVRDRLWERWQELCLDPGEQVYLARLMSLPIEDDAALDGLDGEQLKKRTFRAVEHFLECLARKRPLVMVCEDLHWADPSSLELLGHLLPLVERVPLLLIAVFRPEGEHGCWRLREKMVRYKERYHEVWLEPLTVEEGQQLVGNLLRVEGLPAALRQRILQQAEGNPFYVEEIIRSLMNEGVIGRDEATGRWVALQNVAEISIPDTLQGVLMARIDRLEEDTKRVLQMASVIGRLFFYRVLAAIAHEEQRLDQHLRILEEEEMIRERARIPELEYIFKHHLTQQAAYNGLLKQDRRVFHRQVAEALERLFAGQIEQQVGLLAHHWEQAEEVEKAIAYLLRAGDQARLVYAHEEAIDFYQRALRLLKEQEEYEQAARTLMKLGLTYHAAFDFSSAHQAYDEGFYFWQRAGETATVIDPSQVCQTLRGYWPNPQTLDPALTLYIDSADIVRQLFSGLVELSPEMSIVPDIAESWEVADGGLEYLFRLRDDVCWSDGLPLTAHDFEYAWKRALTPATGSFLANLLYDVKGARAYHLGESTDADSVMVRAPDDRTLQVQLEQPSAYFLHLLSTPVAFPVPRRVVEAHGAAWTEVQNIVANGPFCLESWQPEHHLALARNLHHHRRIQGNVQRIELSLQRQAPSAQLAAYGAGQVDILSLSGFSPQELDETRQRYAGEYVSVPILRTQYMVFDARLSVFDDVRVRCAFAMAMDRERLADVAMRGYDFPASGGFIPPGMPGHSPGIGLLYDPDRARQLLAEAGYPGGAGFPPLEAMVGMENIPWVEELQAQWLEILGIDVPWETMDPATFEQRRANRRPGIFSIGWTADYPDPDNFLRVCPAWRLANLRNETLGQLVDQACRSMDQAKRISTYRHADRILIEEAIVIPLFYARAHLLIKPWITKYPTSAICTVFWQDVVVDRVCECPAEVG